MDPPVPDRLGKEQETDRFVNQIREDRADGAGDEPAAVVEEIAQYKAKDDPGQQVEEDVHCRFPVWCGSRRFIMDRYPAFNERHERASGGGVIGSVKRGEWIQNPRGVCNF